MCVLTTLFPGARRLNLPPTPFHPTGTVSTNASTSTVDIEFGLQNLGGVIDIQAGTVSLNGRLINVLGGLVHLRGTGVSLCGLCFLLCLSVLVLVCALLGFDS